MAVLTIAGDLAGANLSDNAPTKWGKRITSRKHIDLKQSDGRAITAPFLDWGSAVAISAGEFLALATDTGRGPNKYYSYALVGIGEDDQPTLIDHYTRDDKYSDKRTWHGPLSQIATWASVSDNRKATALNAPLYAVALYCDLELERSMLPIERVNFDAAEKVTALFHARQALRALTPELRAQLLAEFSSETVEPMPVTSYRRHR